MKKRLFLLWLPVVLLATPALAAQNPLHPNASRPIIQEGGKPIDAPGSNTPVNPGGGGIQVQPTNPKPPQGLPPGLRVTTPKGPQGLGAQGLSSKMNALQQKGTLIGVKKLEPKPR